MTIHDFYQKYAPEARPIQTVVRGWVLEKEVKDFLGTTVMAGVTVGDLMIGDRLIDTISPASRQAFANLMGTRADTREEIERIILEKLEQGNDPVRGLMNKIQGQLGEDTFVRLVGPAATLASDRNQEAWDVRVSHDDHFQYVQVKVYEDPEGVVEHLERLKEKLSAGSILGEEGVSVSNIDVAVTSEMYETMRERAMEMGYPGEILNLGVTREDLREILRESFWHVEHPFSHFFGEILGDVGKAAALHAIANAFLLYKGAKDRQSAAEDTFYSSGISAGGLLAATTVDELLGHGLLALDLQDAAALLSGPIGGILLLGVSMSTRAFLHRIADRRFVVRRLIHGNDNLARLIGQLEAFA